ncbi:MAG: DUF4410 domain-containing protein [Planctomycetales bacterium]|nr:DUF4410 domain-containing protein [Planctomycetales bacterium]
MTRTVALVLLATGLAAPGCSRAYFRLSQPPMVSFSQFRQVEVQPLGMEGEWTSNEKLRAAGGEASVSIPQRAVAYLQNYGRFASAGGAPGEAANRPGVLVVTGSIYEFNPGSRAARWLAGGYGAGYGRLTARIQLLDGGSGQVVAGGDAFGDVSGGWGGGSFGQAYEETARGIAQLVMYCQQVSP